MEPHEIQGIIFEITLKKYS